MWCMQLLTVNGSNGDPVNLDWLSFLWFIRFVESTTIKQTVNCLQGEMAGDVDEDWVKEIRRIRGLCTRKSSKFDKL